MKEKNKIYALVCIQHLIFAFFISSCAVTYVPNVVNAPMLDQKGEFQAAVNYGVSGFDPQLSYALSDNIGIMLNGSFANRTSDSTENFSKHNFYELGVGYYTKLNDHMNFETFFGGGFGDISSLNDNIFGKYVVDADQYRFFVQPTLGTTRKNVDIGVSTRVVMVNVSNELTNDTKFFIEPVGTIKVGSEYLKFVTQVGFSIPTVEAGFNNNPLLISVGLNYQFGKYR